MYDYQNWETTVTVRDIYGQVPPIPEGFEPIAFRIPKDGEWYLQCGTFTLVRAHNCTLSYTRLILREKKPRRWIVEEDKNAHLTLFVDNAIFPVHVRVVEEVK